MQSGTRTKIEVRSADDKLLERVMKVVNDNISNAELTVDEVASQVGISRVHLHRKLKELTNQTTRDFIRNVRLKMAADMLSQKKYSISEVADLTGFNNPNTFSVAFKELYGVSPSVYMEQHLNINGGAA
jgi:AraC-like DNA-binding protein